MKLTRIQTHRHRFHPLCIRSHTVIDIHVDSRPSGSGGADPDATQRAQSLSTLASASASSSSGPALSATLRFVELASCSSETLQSDKRYRGI
jgi:hypothetical protein